MRWIYSPQITADHKLNQQYGKVMAQILYARGIEDELKLEQYLNGSLNAIYSPDKLPGTEAATNAIIKAIEEKKKIFIYGDYDVDGVCSTSILFDFLYRKLKADVMPYIPDRFIEGYGLNETGLDFLIEQNAGLVITVDCGIRDAAIIEKYSKKGLNFIVTDHHTLALDNSGNPSFPEKALAVVHPGLPGSVYPFKEICATTVVWKLIIALAQKTNLQSFNQDEYLDLVALATVCDVMPLQDENRQIVKQGILKLRTNPNPGLQTLINVSDINSAEIDAYHLGFILGPKVNAGGRIKHALTGVKLFTSQSSQIRDQMATELTKLNHERQLLTQSLLDEAHTIVGASTEKLIFVEGADWSEGVVGLVAGKLLEKYNRPVLVASIKNGIVKGSARSIRSFNITDAIARSSDLLERFGGHHMAAGFTLKESNLDAFKSAMIKSAQVINDADLEQELVIDAQVGTGELNWELVGDLEKMRPYGFGNKEPVMSIENIVLQDLRFLGGNRQHLKLVLNSQTNSYEAIGFNMANLGSNLKKGDIIDIAFNLSVNEWNGRKSIQLKLKDVKRKTD